MQKRIYHTTASFGQLVKLETNNEYQLIGDYEKSSLKTQFKHVSCGTKYEATPNKFLAGRRCPECWEARRGDTTRSTTDAFKQKVAEATGSEYEVLGEYASNNELILMRHTVPHCNAEFKQRPADFLRKGNPHRCSVCAMKKTTARINLVQPKKSHEQFLTEVAEMHDGSYTVIGQYASSKTKIDMHHKKCGSTYAVTPNDFLDGVECPLCNRVLPKESKKLTYLKSVLDANGIQWVEEARFDGCKYKRLLPFDLCIFTNEEDYFLVEYNGRQHYAPTLSLKNSQELFEVQCIRDKIKIKFCEEQGIKLHVIRYDDKHVEKFLDILEEEFSTSVVYKLP